MQQNRNRNRNRDKEKSQPQSRKVRRENAESKKFSAALIIKKQNLKYPLRFLSVLCGSAVNSSYTRVNLMRLSCSYSFLFSLFTLFILTACGSVQEVEPGKLIAINIIDRNGFTETVNSQERLQQYERVNFTSNLPYDKVTRIFSRDAEGNVRAIMTNYYPNGGPKQYLEVLNGRAYGTYKEWHENGTQRLQAFLVGGEGDLDLSHASGWQFDDMSYAWDDQGQKVASIPYSKGKMEGTAEFYFPNGSLKQTLHYFSGMLEGPSTTYYFNQSIAYSENYQNGFLQTGEYNNFLGEKCAEIINGKGKRCIYQDDGSYVIETFYQGMLEGEISHYTSQNQLERQYFIKNGQKTGEETLYYTSSPHLAPKLLLTWNAGVLQGTTKTWYANGKMESRREISQNKKNGLSTAWYKDGSLMLIEEYERDKLMKGEYFKKGEKQAVSRIENGEGVATLFDADGRFLQKITYRGYEPLLP